MVGGTVIDIVKVNEHKWWVNCVESFARAEPQQCAIYLDPRGHTIEVGDSLWWQGRSAYWTPVERTMTDVELPRIGYSGVAHPDEPRCEKCGCTLAFCRRQGVCEVAHV